MLLLYAILRKSQALHRKFTSASSGPDNDHEAVFPARDGLMADADTQLGGQGRPIRKFDPDRRHTVKVVELLCLLTGAHPGGFEGEKAHVIVLHAVVLQAVTQEAVQRQSRIYEEVPVQPADVPLPVPLEPFRGERGPDGAGQFGDAVRDLGDRVDALEVVGDAHRDYAVFGVLCRRAGAAGAARTAAENRIIHELGCVQRRAGGEGRCGYHPRKGEGKELFQFHGRILRSLWCF